MFYKPKINEILREGTGVCNRYHVLIFYCDIPSFLDTENQNI